MINTGRVILGGLVAGLVANLFDFVTNVYLFADEMTANAQRLNLDPNIMNSTPTMVTWIVVDFVYGLLIVFTYAAMRPRFGPGPKTAAIAGVTLWAAITAILVGLLATGFFMQAGFIKIAAVSLVTTVIASLVGCALYKE